MIAQQALAAVQTVLAVVGIFQTFAQIPLGIGIPLGLAAIAGMYALISNVPSIIGSVADGVIEPGALTGPGGGMILSGEKGSLALDPDDTVVAGTNLNGNNNRQQQKQLDLTPLLRKMDEMIAAVKKGKVLSVDGYALNEAMHLEKTPSGV